MCLTVCQLQADLSWCTHSVHGHGVLSLPFVRFTFASASPDNIKQWKFPDGNFLQNLTGHNSIINCLAVNGDNVLVSGGMCVCTYIHTYMIGVCLYELSVPGGRWVN